MNTENLKKIAKEWKKGTDHRWYFDVLKTEKIFGEIYKKFDENVLGVDPTHALIDGYYDVTTNKIISGKGSKEHNQKMAPVRAELWAAIRDYCDIPK